MAALLRSVNPQANNGISRVKGEIKPRAQDVVLERRETGVVIISGNKRIPKSRAAASLK